MAVAPTRSTPSAARRRAGLRLVDAPAGAASIAAPAPPIFRAGLVARPRLVARLAGARDEPVALIVAPAGYGKTSLLAEWAASDARPFAWVALDDRHDDAGVLVEEVARALDQIDPADGAVRRPPFVLVLDDVHVLHSAAALEALGAIADEIPPGSQLAIASRTEPAISLARLRAHRLLAEIRARDLAMTSSEGAALFATAGPPLTRRDLAKLVRHTEGWPAALYLAALCLSDQVDARLALRDFAGDDVVVADYIRDEVLADLPPRSVEFLRRTSVLDELSGPACDALLERRGSARQLAELARAGALLVPLDRSGSSYRCHTLLREMLRGELRRIEPDREPALHRRASAWHAAHGEPERAIEHAISTGDAALAGDRLATSVTDYAAKGRSALLARWLSALGSERIATHPALALAAADNHLTLGELDAAHRWGCVAAKALKDAQRDERAGGLQAGIAIVRAATAGDGLAALRRRASRAYRLAPEDSPWRAHCCLLTGVAHHLTGDGDAARTALEEGARRAAVAAPSIQRLCLAQLALLAAEHEDWESAAAHAARATAQIERYELADYPTSAVVFAASAWIRARRGRFERGRQDAGRARRLLERLDQFLPWYEAQARTALACAEIRLGDLPAARELLGEASRLAKREAEAVALRACIRDAQTLVTPSTGASHGISSPLTPSELRVLAFLPTHLSFREIGGRLCVSANTVKTHAHAAYRKLGASSRSEAVDRARRLGLLDTAD